MKAHERSVESQASPEAVWRIWSDTSTWGDWNPNVSSMEMNGPFVAGTSGTMHTRAGRSHAMRLAAVEPGRSFQLETSPLPMTRFLFRCEVAPAGQGKSRLSQSLTMQGPLAPVFSPLAGDRVAATFEPLLRGLAARAEGKQAAS